MKTLSLDIDVQDLMISTKIYGEILKNNQPIPKCKLSNFRGTSLGAPLLNNSKINLKSRNIYTYSISDLSVSSVVQPSIEQAELSSNIKSFSYDTNSLRGSRFTYNISNLKLKQFVYSISDLSKKEFRYSIDDLSSNVSNITEFKYTLSRLRSREFKYSIADLIASTVEFKYAISSLQADAGILDSMVSSKIELRYPISFFTEDVENIASEVVNVEDNQDFSKQEIVDVSKDIISSKVEVPKEKEDVVSKSDKTDENNKEAGVELNSEVEDEIDFNFNLDEDIDDLIDTPIENKKEVTEKVEAKDNIDVLPKEMIPKDIVEFLRMYPSRCEISEVEKYFSQKEISLALRMGKIIKKKNKYRI